jgi:UDP-GlcNAc:undecaprenyl-phosphate GlcNAc-1-phosphate transferase
VTALLLALPLLVALSALATRAMIARPLLDLPDQRKAHTQPTPTAGGVAVVAAILAGMAVLWAADDPAPAAHLPLLAGICAMAAIGWLDDRHDLAALPRLGAQILAALVAIASGLSLERIMLPGLGIIELGPAGPVITLVWFLACTNAVNFLDGADGLIGGTLLVVAIALALAGVVIGAPFVVALALCLAAGLAGFLPFNWHPARIFLGDAGSQAAGFLLAGLGVAAAGAAEARLSFLIVPLLLGAVLFDAGFTLARRALAGEPVLRPHRAHLYQMAIRAGWPVRRIALLHAGFAALHGVLALLVLVLPRPVALLPPVLALAVQLIWLTVVLRAMRRAGLRFSTPP